MTMLRYEKDKSLNPKEFPENPFSIAIQQLINLANTDQRPEIANLAKKLAIELSGKSSIAQLVKTALDNQPARIYFHFQDRSQQQTVDDDKMRMLGKLGKNYIVPNISYVHEGPQNTELRYFLRSDTDVALRISEALKDAGVGDIKAQFISGRETETRPKHFELWYGKITPKSTTPQ